MKKQGYKTKLRHDFAECLLQLIDKLLVAEWQDDEDKLHMCVLKEIRICLFRKTEACQKEYKITFSYAQAFALRLLFTNYITDRTTYLGNRLMQIANDVHKHYS